MRSVIATGLGPVYWLGNAPYRFSDWFSGLFVSRDDLQQENEELKTRLLILERRALKYAALASENNELRRLLNSSEVLDDRVIVGEVVAEVLPDPFSHEVVINKGSNDGVTTGQAVLDAEGLLGQVIQTSQFTSRVLLVSDGSHAVPVEVVRGLRSILLGNGETDELELVHVPDTADIREGDMLVSSGLGGRFPRGLSGGRSQQYFQGAGRALCGYCRRAKGPAEPEPPGFGGVPA